MISKDILQKIKSIIENNYNALLVGILGEEVLTEEELQALKDEGIDIEPERLLESIYYHNILNQPTDPHQPTTLEAAKEQQVLKPEKAHHKQAEEHINESFRVSLDKLKADTQQNFESILREYNLLERNKELAGEAIRDIVPENNVSRIKQKLRDASGDGTRDFSRIAVTETANAIGLGSVDRIIEIVGDTDLDEVHVYRISVMDTATCRFCKHFYNDEDGSPAVYRLSTLLSNGTNYGLRSQEWKPVVTSTHPNDRETGCIQLRKGWKVLPGGSVEFIGNTKWHEYIAKKVRS